MPKPADRSSHANNCSPSRPTCRARWSAWKRARARTSSVRRFASKNGAAFRKGRECAAWLGLIPRQHSTGGKARLLGISKRGSIYLRRLFIHGARAMLLRVKYDTGQLGIGHINWNSEHHATKSSWRSPTSWLASLKVRFLPRSPTLLESAVKMKNHSPEPG